MSDHPLVHRVLNECEVMLGHSLERTVIADRAQRAAPDCPDGWSPAVVFRFELAYWRLTGELASGFSARTPGNGDPGGGRGATVTSRGSDDSVGPDANSQPERLAIANDGRLPELDDLKRLQYSPLRIIGHTDVLYRSCGGGTLPPVHGRETGPSARLLWSRFAIRELLADQAAVELASFGRCRAVHRAVEELDRIVRRYGYDVSKPAVTAGDREMLATDLTETWCRSCLRVGRREPRYRGDLCQWCYRFQTSEGFLPPADVIEVRGRYGTVTDAMVEPHRQRHRDRQRSQRRRLT